MDITIFPQKLQGQVRAIPSKSQAHRLFLCAALADRPTQIEIPTLCDDLAATIGCLVGFGGEVVHLFGQAEVVTPIHATAQSAVCNCGESGSTLRFMLPLAGALGIDTLFLLEGRLPYRPLSPLWVELERHGCRLSWVRRTQLQSELGHVPRAVTAGLRLRGTLRPGHYRLDGNISSQFISGLLMALPLLDGESYVELIGPVSSRPYIEMTLKTLSLFGVHWENFRTLGRQTYISPEVCTVEGDWSNAAFWLAANALGSEVHVDGLRENSVQGDKAVCELLPRLRENISFSAADTPDLVPVLAVVAAANRGAVITDIARLRLKESDRVAAIVDLLNSLGGHAVATENELTIYPAPLLGGTVDARNDHRIAMAAAVASTVCTRPVTILDAQCVSKSYPAFWKEFTRLGGKI